MKINLTRYMLPPSRWRSMQRPIMPKRRTSTDLETSNLSVLLFVLILIWPLFVVLLLSSSTDLTRPPCCPKHTTSLWSVAAFPLKLQKGAEINISLKLDGLTFNRSAFSKVVIQESQPTVLWFFKWHQRVLILAWITYYHSLWNSGINNRHF